jgi:hypothetical protein
MDGFCVSKIINMLRIRPQEQQVPFKGTNWPTYLFVKCFELVNKIITEATLC